MDSITQAALGASVGFFCWHRQLGRKALVAGAVLGTIPDLDIVIYPLLDSVARLYWHRGESHSLFFIVLGAMVTGWGMTRLFSRDGLNFRAGCSGAFLIYATHILIDLYTVYGTQLLAPVSRHGYALGNMFIVDPLFTLMLFTGITAAAISPQGMVKRLNSLALCGCVLYSFWSLGMQQLAHFHFQQATKKSNVQVIRQLTSASPFTTFLWRHVVETPDGFMIGYWSIFDGDKRKIEFYSFQQHTELIEGFRESKAFEALEWFSKGWWAAVPGESQSIKVIDIRFTEIPSTDYQSFSQWNWPFVWVFDSQQSSYEGLRPLRPENIKPVSTLKLLVRRIAGGGGWLNGLEVASWHAAADNSE